VQAARPSSATPSRRHVVRARGPASLPALEPGPLAAAHPEPDPTVEPAKSITRPKTGLESTSSCAGLEWHGRRGHRWWCPRGDAVRGERGTSRAWASLDVRGACFLPLGPLPASASKTPVRSERHPDPHDGIVSPRRGCDKVSRPCRHARDWICDARRWLRRVGRSRPGGAHASPPRPATGLCVDLVGSGTWCPGEGLRVTWCPAAETLCGRVDPEPSVPSAAASLVGWPRTGCAHGWLRSPPLWYDGRPHGSLSTEVHDASHGTRRRRHHQSSDDHDA